MQIIALGAAYIVAVTALDTVTNVGAIDDLTSTARIVLVRAPALSSWHQQLFSLSVGLTGPLRRLQWWQKAGYGVAA